MHHPQPPHPHQNLHHCQCFNTEITILQWHNDFYFYLDQLHWQSVMCPSSVLQVYMSSAANTILNSYMQGLRCMCLSPRVENSLDPSHQGLQIHILDIHISASLGLKLYNIIDVCIYIYIYFKVLLIDQGQLRKPDINWLNSWSMISRTSWSPASTWIMFWTHNIDNSSISHQNGCLHHKFKQ